MLYTQVTEPYKTSCFEREKPIPQKGEVLVKMERVGICASDVQIYHGKHKYMKFPLTQGHEGCGWVEAVGEGVENVHVGDHVVVQPQLFCGHCFTCLQDRQNICENGGHLGVTHAGLLSEYITVPEWNAVPIPADMNPDDAAMVEPFSIACNAVEKGDIHPGDRVIVLGSGFIGNLVAQACKIAGAEVISTDQVDEKLEMLRKDGILHTVNTSKEELKDKVKEVFRDRGIHVIYDCVGLPATFAQAVSTACKGSKIVIVGNFKEPITFEIPQLQRREIALLSVYGTSRKNFLDSLHLISTGKVHLEGKVSGRYPLNKLDDAYAFIDQNRNTIRVLITI